MRTVHRFTRALNPSSMSRAVLGLAPVLMRRGWLSVGCLLVVGLTLALLPPGAAISPPTLVSAAAGGPEQGSLAALAAPVVRKADTGAKTWYFAEGFTGAGFDEYLTIYNPGDAGTATITYYIEGQATAQTRTVQLAALSRTTVTVHLPQSATNPGGLGRGYAHSTKVETTVNTIVERPMYFVYNTTITGGHNVIGATEPAGTWNFAEGYTGPGFDEYLTLFNPNTTAATANITYFIQGQATPQTRSVSLLPQSRTTVIVFADQSPSNPGGLGRLAEGIGHATKIESQVPIVAERPMYFTYNGSTTGITGGHDVIGTISQPAVCMAALRGAEEVPPVTTPGAGAVRLTVDPVTGVIKGEWVVNGLTSAITAAHIHPGAMGITGSPIVPFTGLPAAGGAFMTTGSTTPAQAATILANPAGFYVNVHTANNGGGEVRGQLSCTGVPTTPGATATPTATATATAGAPTATPTATGMPPTATPTATATTAI